MSRIALVLLLGLGGACAHPAPEAAPAPRASEGSVLAASPDSLWRTLPAVYERLGLAVTTSDSADHRLASSEAVDLWAPVIGPLRAPYAKCAVPALTELVSAALASGPYPNRLPVRVPPGRVMFTVETELSPADGGSRVATRVLASPITTGSSGGAPYCVSTGRLEARIAGALNGANAAADDG